MTSHEDRAATVAQIAREDIEKLKTTMSTQVDGLLSPAYDRALAGRPEDPDSIERAISTVRTTVHIGRKSRDDAWAERMAVAESLRAADELDPAERQLLIAEAQLLAQTPAANGKQQIGLAYSKLGKSLKEAEKHQIAARLLGVQDGQLDFAIERAKDRALPNRQAALTIEQEAQADYAEASYYLDLMDMRLANLTNQPQRAAALGVQLKLQRMRGLGDDVRDPWDTLQAEGRAGAVRKAAEKARRARTVSDVRPGVYEPGALAELQRESAVAAARKSAKK